MSQNQVRPDGGFTPGTPPSIPRWVKVFGIIFIVLILLFVILHLTGNSLGGPGSHLSLIEHRVQQL